MRINLKKKILKGKKGRKKGQNIIHQVIDSEFRVIKVFPPSKMIRTQ